MNRTVTPDRALAINGGRPVRAGPLPLRRLFGQEEKQAVVALFDQAIEQGNEVLGYNGPQEQGYCEAFAELMGGGFADGVNSGTNALYVALRALEPEPFSEVIVPAVSDSGGVMPVVLCNCIPVPADTAPDSFNIGADQIEARITDRTCAIIVAHISGTPADLDPILTLARARRIPVIEDCAQAHGAHYKGQVVGSLGDVSVFSTMFGKHHATGGQGGVVFTKQEPLYWRIRRYADRGKPFGLQEQGGNVVASLNCNMDEIHAAIGRAQLKKLPGIIRRRRELAATIGAGCEQSLQAVRLMGDPPDCQGAYWFLLFQLDLDRVGLDKVGFVKALTAEGFGASPSYLIIPTRMPWHQKRAVFGTSGLPWSGAPRVPEAAGPQQAYTLPNVEAADAPRFLVHFHEDWTDQEATELVAALAKVEGAYLR